MSLTTRSRRTVLLSYGKVDGELNVEVPCRVLTTFRVNRCFSLGGMEVIVVVANENDGIRFHFFDMIYVPPSVSGLNYKL